MSVNKEHKLWFLNKAENNGVLMCCSVNKEHKRWFLTKAENNSLLMQSSKCVSK